MRGCGKRSRRGKHGRARAAGQAPVWRGAPNRERLSLIIAVLFIPPFIINDYTHIPRRDAHRRRRRDAALAETMTIRTFQGVTPQVDPTAFVDAAAVVIGAVVIGADSSVWPMCVLRGDINSIRVGACTNIQDGSILHVTEDTEYTPGGFALEIGDDVTIGHAVVLHACTIRDRSLVGMGAVVLDGAVVELSLIHI